MKTAVWLLTKILEAAVRIEHKLDLVIHAQKSRPDSTMNFLPELGKTQSTDPVSLKPVQYGTANLRTYGLQVWHREPEAQPDAATPPKTIGDD